MVHILAGFNPGAGGAGGKDHGGEPPFPVFPGKGLGHEKRRRDDVVTSAQRRIQLDGAVHGPVVGIDLLDIHAIDFRVFVMDKATADGAEFLGTVPVPAHMDEHGIGVEELLQRIGIFVGHKVPDPLGKVGKRLRLDAVCPVVEHREGLLGTGRQSGKEQAGQQ